MLREGLLERGFDQKDLREIKGFERNWRRWKVVGIWELNLMVWYTFFILFLSQLGMFISIMKKFKHQWNMCLYISKYIILDIQISVCFTYDLSKIEFINIENGRDS